MTVVREVGASEDDSSSSEHDEAQVKISPPSRLSPTTLRLNILTLFHELIPSHLKGSTLDFSGAA